MDYLNYKNWKNSHAKEMEDLSLACKDDIFVFTRFSSHFPFEWESKQIVFGSSIEEVIGYIRHIYLYDILNDCIDDLEFKCESPEDFRLKDTISVLSYWYKIGKLSTSNIDLVEVKKLFDEFNAYFNSRKHLEYEVKILNGTQELQKFLIDKFEKCDDFDKEKIYKICSKDSFSGKLLNEFLKELFRN